MKLTVGSCFSGIGGLELGLEWTGGFETKWQIEWDDYASRVLEKHWPNVKRYRDIRDVVRPDPIDVITGGYPCQPFSYNGLRQGDQDERHLWPELLRLIRDIRPKYAIMENVAGHLSLGFGRVIGDLAKSGYDAEWQVLSARQFGASHLRRRIFIVAYPSSNRRNTPIFHHRITQKHDWVSGEYRSPSHQEVWGLPSTRIRRGFNGFPTWVDELKCYGNAVSPPVAKFIGEMILKFESRRTE